MQVTPHGGQQNWTSFILLKGNDAKTVNLAFKYGVRMGSKAAVLVHCYFFTGAPVKFSGGTVKIPMRR